jgi:hypothetical protein
LIQSAALLRKCGGFAISAIVSCNPGSGTQIKSGNRIIVAGVYLIPKFASREDVRTYGTLEQLFRCNGITANGRLGAATVLRRAHREVL